MAPCDIWSAEVYFLIIIILLQCHTCIVKIKRSIHFCVISHASKNLCIYPSLHTHTLTHTRPIHHCELFDHLTKYSVSQS